VKRLYLFLILSAFLYTSCETAGREGQVTILHTNDMHSQFVPLAATWIDADPKPYIGGMVALEYAVRQARATFPHSLLLDAGDISTGTLLSKIEHNGALNGGFVEMMNLMDYDAFTIGNHEFDEGQDNLAKLVGAMDFDVISANLLINDELFAPHAYKIYNVGNIRVGVIGILLTNLANVTAKKNLDNVVIADPAETTQRIIDQIDAKTDLIVVLTHQGDDDDEQLAGQLSNADVIVGGHSHTRITEAREVNNILIVQAGSKTRYLGRLTVDVAGDTISSFASELIPTWVDSVTSPHPDMEKLVNTYKSQIDAEYGQQISMLKTAWKNSNFYETNLGNFLSDVMREKTSTDFAFLNSGGIRKSLPAGPITKMDVLEILPFSNYLTTFECSGQVLFDILQNDIQGAVKNSYGLFQMSGVKYAFQVDDDESAKIISMTINGQAIDPNATYTGTTVDFVMSNLQERYEISNIQESPELLSDVVIEYLEKNPVIESKVEGRIRKVK
jgi:2',3'-cyclic-nucleotide 2'-phosphodiesterase (5'-nucleotidase family)